MSRPRTANPGTYDNDQIVQDEDGELLKPKRKKSVHFPDNPVIPIDDSSYENSQGPASPMGKNLNVSEDLMEHKVNKKRKPVLLKNNAEDLGIRA